MPEKIPANVPVAQPKKGFPRKFGRYILEKNLSRGGMGEVYLAIPRGAQKRCVIKTIRGDLTGEKEFVGRFADEAKIMVRMQHDNIIRVFDCGRVGTDYYIAMEFLYGKDLGDILDRAYERGEPMPKDIGLHIVLALLEGLDYAHNLTDEKGRPMRLVHRDISPQNVLIGFDGSIKLIDFGLARTELLPARTQGALAVGKYGYMSPEQARHEPIDGRADIYSFGVMLFEVFTGDRLVDEQDQATLWARVLNPKHRPPSTVIPDIGKDIDEMIMTAVAVDANDRFQSAREMSRFVRKGMRTKPCTTERMLKYMRYLYPQADFNPPPLPTFGKVPEPSEKSMIIAMSEEAAKTAFAEGELPVEWTMQIDAESLKALRQSRTPKEEDEDRRKDGATAVVRDEQKPRAKEDLMTPPSERARARADDDPPHFHEVDDGPTTIANPANVLEEGTLDEYEDTKFEKPRFPEPRAKSPVTQESTVNDDKGPVRPLSQGFGDDEATVMMNMPPTAVRTWGKDDVDESTEFVEPTVLANPRPSAPPKPNTRPAKEKNDRNKDDERGRDKPKSLARPNLADVHISEKKGGPNYFMLGALMLGATALLLVLVMVLR